jgi:pilus assembly protein Flp/PilA
MSAIQKVRNERGQGLIEYLIIVALMGVATIGIVRVMGQAVTSHFATITYALRGETHKPANSALDKSLYKKKDLGDFFNGSGKGAGGGNDGSIDSRGDTSTDTVGSGE